MDTGSEAETAESLHATSDAAQTVNSATYNEPHSTYPHPLSLPSPVGIADKERHPEEDAAIRYVTAKAGELRNLRKNAKSDTKHEKIRNSLFIRFAKKC